MQLATPPLPVAAMDVPGQLFGLPLTWSVMPAWSALSRNLVKLAVVPDSASRWHTTMLPVSPVTPEFVAAIAGSAQVEIVPEKILVSVGPSRCSGLVLATPATLYDTVIGAATVGKYRKSPPVKVAFSASFTGRS